MCLVKCRPVVVVYILLRRIIVNEEMFSLDILNVSIPNNLEIIWGLLRPKDESAVIKKIILCSFYSPPRSHKKSILIDHIVTTLHIQNTIYPDAPIILGADINDLGISPILNCGLRLKQIVDLPTRNDKILDVLIMNLSLIHI